MRQLLQKRRICFSLTTAGAAAGRRAARRGGRPAIQRAPSSDIRLAEVGPAGCDGSIRFGFSLLSRSFAFEPVDLGVGKAWISSSETSLFNGLCEIFREKNSRALVLGGRRPNGGSAGTGGSAAHVERIDHEASLAPFLIFVNRLSRDTLLQKLQLQTSAAAVRFRPPQPVRGSRAPPIARDPEARRRREGISRQPAAR